MPLSAAEAQILESHDERISRAEERVVGLVTDVAVVKNELASVKDRVTTGFHETKLALDSLSTAMKLHSESSVERQNAIMEKLQAADQAKAVEQAQGQAKAAIVGLASKPVVGIVALTAGGLLAKVGEWLLSFFVHR